MFATKPLQISESGFSKNIAFAVCQIPGKTDEDKYSIITEHFDGDNLSMASFGVFDGHRGVIFSSKN